MKIALITLGVIGVVALVVVLLIWWALESTDEFRGDGR